MLSLNKSMTHQIKTIEPMTRRSYILLAVLTLAIAGSASAQKSDLLLGHWIGVADGQINFTIDIVFENDAYAGSVDAPNNGVINRPMLSADVDGSSFTLVFDVQPGAALTMDGKLHDDGSVTGSYDFGENFGTFEMKRAEPAAGDEDTEAVDGDTDSGLF